ncbi:hypothetical protein, partial [Escherichia coli]|uniref:hypothetical protein n=1 Tax=Escherichia coli TaxID=562 RepID=UPI001BC8B6B0
DVPKRHGQWYRLVFQFPIREQHRCSNEKINFSAEFKSQSAQLVVDQNYTVADATLQDKLN